MPILQSRVIAVINAGLDYKQAYDALATSITDLTSQAWHTKRDPHEIIEEIRTLVANRNNLLNQPFESLHVLLTEYDQFARNAQRNVRSAAAMRRKRGSSEPIRKSHAPIYAAHSVNPSLIPPAPISIPTPISNSIAALSPEQAAFAAAEFSQRQIAKLAQASEEAENASIDDSIGADPFGGGDK